jgi:hypothetical protein
VLDHVLEADIVADEVLVSREDQYRDLGQDTGEDGDG